MTAFFQTVLQMSLTGSYVILVVLIARLFLKKAPTVLSYLLWFAVLFRLICPLSLETSFSLVPALIPEKVEISQQTGGQLAPGVETSQTEREPFVNNGTDSAVNNGSDKERIEQSASPLESAAGMDKEKSTAERWLTAAGFIWLGGTSVMLVSGIVSATRLNRRLRKAWHDGGRIYEWGGAQTPFVFGLLRPRIILPPGLGQHERGYIIIHEQIHIRRFDHLVKLVAFAVLCLHWFNPLVWIAVRLMDADMEKSCDEAVIRQMGSSIKKEYSTSLLALSTGRRYTGRSPLAFGENNTKGRIKNIMNYRKPSVWAVSSAVTIVIIAVAVAGLTGNHRSRTVTERDYAHKYIAEQIASIENGASGAVIVNNEITIFKKAGRVEGLLTEPLELWRLEYRLEPEEISKLQLAGGMNAIDGKITEDGSMGKPLLVFAYEGAAPRYEGVIWSAEYDLSTAAGQETALRIFMEGKGKLPHETYSGSHALAKFIMSTGETAQLLLSQPAGQGDSGIWFVERWKDGNGYEYYHTPRTSLPAGEYFAQLQAEADQGKQRELLDPAQAAAQFVRSELNWNLQQEQIQLQIPATAADFAVSPVSELLGYVSDLSLNEAAFKFDNAEWLTDDEDPDRLRNLGLDPDNDMPGGFYILNKYAVKDRVELAGKAQYAVIDGAELKEVSKKEFIARLRLMSEFGMLCTISMQDGKVIRVEERYLP